MKIKTFFFLLSVIPCTGVRAQQDLSKFLKDAQARADAIKKANPQAKPKSGLPDGYDNSWRMYITLNRTVNRNTDLYGSGGCGDSKKGTLSYTLRSDMSSDQALGWLNGDDFQLNTDIDDEFKKYVHPLKGSFQIHSSSSSSEVNCGGSTNSQYDGGVDIEPDRISFSFDYNRKTKKGNFTVNVPSDYQAHASGKSVYRPKKGQTVTQDIGDLGKARIGILTAVCGVFQATNYAVSTNADIQQVIASSPVNGERASISETKSGYEISYSQSATVRNPLPADEKGTDEITYNTSVHILITDKNPPNLEAILEPDDETAYKNFIPAGAKLDGSTDKGNSLGFSIRIIDKKTGKDVTSGHPFTVTYSLDKVSQYKGICMNYPRHNADEKPDLRWDTLCQAESAKASLTENTLVSNQREGNMLRAYIRSYDYAAYGILKARVHLDDDQLDLDAHLKSNPDEPFACIPLDDNHNHIADKWEKDVQVYGKTDDPNFDEDELPKNQRRNGDGYTLFEEYRGFKVKDNLLPSGSHESFADGHLRMDPEYKDIFINDEDGLFKTYYEPYNPSDLCWHYIDKDEMIFTASGSDPQNRWTNFNKVGDHFYANQYALILDDKPAESGDATLGVQLDANNVKDYESSKDPDALEKLRSLLLAYLIKLHDQSTSSAPKTSFGFDQAVKHTIIIDVYSGKITQQAKYFESDKQQGVYTILITGVINHEMGHALGITHHRFANGDETDSSRVIGVNDCCMRYLSPTEISRRFLVSRTPYYCHKSDTWQEVVNIPADQLEPGKRVPLKTVTHPSNNCYGQIDVKSDP